MMAMMKMMADDGEYDDVPDDVGDDGCCDNDDVVNEVSDENRGV